jgi:hypothetical protein
MDSNASLRGRREASGQVYACQKGSRYRQATAGCGSRPAKHHHGSEDHVPASLGGRSYAELRDQRDVSKKMRWRAKRDLHHGHSPMLSIIALVQNGEDVILQAPQPRLTVECHWLLSSQCYFLSSSPQISKKTL